MWCRFNRSIGKTVTMGCFHIDTHFNDSTSLHSTISKLKMTKGKATENKTKKTTTIPSNNLKLLYNKLFFFFAHAIYFTVRNILNYVGQIFHNIIVSDSVYGLAKYLFFVKWNNLAVRFVLSYSFMSWNYWLSTFYIVMVWLLLFERMIM